jgi:hypothetical protein
MESFLESVGSTLTDMTACAQSALEHLSWYLADHTGLDADTCYNAVPAFAALVAAASVLSPYLNWQLSLPMSFERAQRPGCSPAPVFWAGRWFPDDRQKWNFAIAGLPRSGKSLLLSLYLRSVISQIASGSDRRLILFDPKNELHPALFAGVQVPVHFVLPTDVRSSRWELSKDFTSPAAATQLSDALVPTQPNDSNPFFANALRDLMAAVITSLNLSQPGRWDLADVVHILESREFTAQVLARYPQTRPLLRYMAEPRTWANIAATVETRLGALRIIAALWSRTAWEKTFSLTDDFVNSEAILVLGRDPKFAALLDPLNGLLLTQLFSQLLAQKDDPVKRRRTHLVIDEFCVANGEKPLPGFADICERGASRGVVVVVAYQSYAHVKALYKEAGDAFLGMLQNQVFLRSDPSTADFAVKAFSKMRGFIEVYSRTTDSHRPGWNSETRSEHWHEWDVVPCEKFIGLRPASPEDGITGYWLSPPPWCDSKPFHLPGWWIAKNLPKNSEEVEPYLMRRDSEQYLEPLSFRDLQRLGLSLPDGEDFAGAAVPKAPLPPTRPGPAAQDDITGKLRRLIGSARSHNDAPPT